MPELLQFQKWLTPSQGWLFSSHAPQSLTEQDLPLQPDLPVPVPVPARPEEHLC